MKALLKSAREAKGLTVVELARVSKIDKALVSKFESGHRMPTLEQIKQFSELLSIDFETLQLQWLTEKLLRVSGRDAMGKKALESALSQLSDVESIPEVPVDKLLQELDVLRNMILKKK